MQEEKQVHKFASGQPTKINIFFPLLHKKIQVYYIIYIFYYGNINNSWRLGGYKIRKNRLGFLDIKCVYVCTYLHVLSSVIIVFCVRRRK